MDQIKNDDRAIADRMLVREVAAFHVECQFVMRMDGKTFSVSSGELPKRDLATIRTALLVMARKGLHTVISEGSPKHRQLGLLNSLMPQAAQVESLIDGASK